MRKLILFLILAIVLIINLNFILAYSSQNISLNQSELSISKESIVYPGEIEIVKGNESTFQVSVFNQNNQTLKNVSIDISGFCLYCIP